MIQEVIGIVFGVRGFDGILRITLGGVISGPLVILVIYVGFPVKSNGLSQHNVGKYFPEL